MALVVTAGDGVGLGDQAGLALADRVAVTVDCAGGAAAAGRGAAWVNGRRGNPAKNQSK